MCQLCANWKWEILEIIRMRRLIETVVVYVFNLSPSFPPIDSTKMIGKLIEKIVVRNSVGRDFFSVCNVRTD